MSVNIDNRRAIKHLLERIDRCESQRRANIGMTLDGAYIQNYLGKPETDILEMVREHHYRRQMTRVFDELKVLGVDIELDFDPTDYREEDTAPEEKQHDL